MNVYGYTCYVESMTRRVYFVGGVPTQSGGGEGAETEQPNTVSSAADTSAPSAPEGDAETGEQEVVVGGASQTAPPQPAEPEPVPVKEEPKGPKPTASVPVPGTVYMYVHSTCHLSQLYMYTLCTLHVHYMTLYYTCTNMYVHLWLVNVACFRYSVVSGMDQRRQAVLL